MFGSSSPRARRGRLLFALCLAGAVGAACQRGVDERVAEARALSEQQKFAESIEVLRGVLEEQPDHPEANFLLGTSLIRNGETTTAIFPLRRAAANEEYALKAGLALARTLAITQNLEDAEQVATDLLERDPDNSEALGLRAQVRLNLGRYDDAIADVDARLKLNEDEAELHFLKAQALLSAKRYDESRASLAKAETLYRDAGELSNAAQSCANAGAVFERMDGNLKRAEQQVERCVADYPTQLTALKALADLFNAQGTPDRAVEAMRRAAAAAPESVETRLLLAEQLYLAKHADEAIQEARQTAEDFSSLQAWLTLAELEIRKGELVSADASLQRAVALASDPEPIRFRRADLMVSRGDLDGAEALAAEFTDPAFQAFVRGRIALRRGDAETALQLLEKGLERWPDNAGARAEAGTAAQQLGQLERALGHYREATRKDAKSSNAGVAGALVAYALGRPAEAVSLIRIHVKEHPFEGPEAYQVGIRAADAADSPEEAEVLLAALDAYGERGIAAAERARRVAAKGGPAEAAKLIEASRLDYANPRSEPGLRALVEARLAQQQGAQALAAVDGALRGDADRASLHDLRGRVLLALARDDEARAAFEKALELKADYGAPHAGLAMLAAKAGDVDGALREFDAASKAPVADPDSAYQAAQLLLSKGDLDGAKTRLEEVTRRLPDHAAAANDLAWILAERKQDLDRAKLLAELAVRQMPSADSIDTLAWVEIQRGDLEDARATLERGLAANPHHPTLLYRLGLAKNAAGDRDGALTAFREALQTGAFPQAEATQAEIARLEGRKGDQR
jgi:tetratricopeptide (TPR) repeat protein